mmetsp:Transcript_47229/g.147714  ORF Transcript_47229/g.147714 Transcript_47229/m.147714 type:complete len:210 (+) Transcript_47229:574-1203(+)
MTVDLRVGEVMPDTLNVANEDELIRVLPGEMTERLGHLVLCFDMTIVVIVLNIFALQIRLNIAQSILHSLANEVKNFHWQEATMILLILLSKGKIELLCKAVRHCLCHGFIKVDFCNFLFIFVVKGIILEDFGDTRGVLAVFVDLIHFVAPSHSSLLEWFTGYHDDAFLTSPFLFVRIVSVFQSSLWLRFSGISIRHRVVDDSICQSAG